MDLKPEAIRPVDIQPIDEKELFIQWHDGDRSRYAFPYLRRSCRCAACVDEWTGEARLRPEKVTEEVRPLKTAPVGNYGIRFDWSDGHSTGIYPFELLRSLCPCKECLPSSQATRDR